MLEAIDLSILLPGKVICDHLNVQVEKGSVLIIEGKNGKGKSTLLSTLIGFKKPTSGRVLLDGLNLHQLTKSQRKIFFSSAGIVLQDPLLKAFDRIHNRMVGTLSPSEKRKEELHRAFQDDHQILFLDDPYLFLDDENIQDLRRIFSDGRRLGKTFVITSHNAHDFNFLNPEKIVYL